jgi:hypothetical protein
MLFISRNIPASLCEVNGAYMDRVGEYMLSPDALKQFHASLSHVSDLVRDDMCFKLMGLITMLDVTDCDADLHQTRKLYPLLTLRLTFLRLLKRRLKKQGVMAEYDSFELAQKHMSVVSQVTGMFLQAKRVPTPKVPTERFQPHGWPQK